MMILGGLLQGVGKGLDDQYQQKREEALLNLKHQFDTEDTATSQKNAIDLQTLKNAGDIEQIHATGGENRQTEGVKNQGDEVIAKIKAASDRNNIVLKGNIDLRNNKVMESMRTGDDMKKAQYQSALDTEKELKVAGVKVGYKVVSPSGEVGFYNEKGDLIAQTKPGTTTPATAGDGEGPSTEELQAANGGGGDAGATTVAPTGNANEKLRKQALTRLPGLYAQARENPEQFKEQYPSMFDENGNLLPMSELVGQVNARYQ